MRPRLLLFALVLAGCLDTPPAHDPAQQAASPARLSGILIDLTHAFDDRTIYWPTEEGFVLEHGTEGYTDQGYYYAAHSFHAAEHGGTHIDAPIHFAEGRRTVDAIPLESLIGPAVVIDVGEAAAQDADYQVAVADFERWEAEHGRIPDGTIILLRTGYGRYWPERVPYMGTDARGAEGVAALHFPGLHPDAARWLVENRSVKAVGLDTPSIDYGQSQLFETHQILFAENIPAFENVAQLDRLPEQGFTIIALPMKIRGGSGAPLRIVAVVPEAG